MSSLTKYYGYSENAAKVEAKKAYRTHLGDVLREVSGCTLPPDDTDTDVNSCTFPLICENAAVHIETKIRMDLKYEVKIEKQETLPDGTKKITYTAEVSKATHHYITYTITHLTAEKGGTSE